MENINIVLITLGVGILSLITASILLYVIIKDKDKNICHLKKLDNVKHVSDVDFINFLEKHKLESIDNLNTVEELILARDNAIFLVKNKKLTNGIEMKCYMKYVNNLYVKMNILDTTILL